MFAWLGDRTCHRITHQAFDNLREQMKELYGLGRTLMALAAGRVAGLLASPPSQAVCRSGLLSCRRHVSGPGCPLHPVIVVEAVLD
eukprot:11997615-Alexandrium_andersonii.AAC.1